MITMKDVIREGNPLLHEKAVDVTIPLSLEDEQILRDMLDYVYNSVNPENEGNDDFRPAVGIAAPQIGVLKKMIAIVAPDEKGNEHEFCLVNPKILSYSDELTYIPGGEGCLSVDRKCDAPIFRPRIVTFKALQYNYETRELKEVKYRLKGYLAVVFQHEYDHLQGVLFVDKVQTGDPYQIPDNAVPVKFKNEEK